MSLTKKHVIHFNRLDGNSISRDTLRKFYFTVKKDVDAKRVTAVMPFGKECLEIMKKLSTAIEQMGDSDVIEKLIVKKYSLRKFTHVAKAKPVKQNKKEKTKVVEAPKSMRESKSLRPPAKRKEHSKAIAEYSKESPTANRGLGFVTADKTPKEAPNTFTLPGAVGKVLGTLQRFKLQIVVPGETHSSKSQLGMQIANAFAAIGDDVAWLDWEQGGLDSKDTQLMIARNTDPQNRKRIYVTGQVPRELDSVKELTKQFKVIALDSGTKIKGQINNAWIDDLREQFPEVVWIIMMQQNAAGGTRGGSAAEFDSPVVLKTFRPDHADFKKNYTTVFKNRGNKTGFNYLINQKKIESVSTNSAS